MPPFSTQYFLDAQERLTGSGGPFELTGISAKGRLFLRGPKSLPELLRRASALSGQPQLIGERTHTFGDVARGAAAILCQCPKIAQGARVVLALTNDFNWMRCFVACLARGAVVILPGHADGEGGAATVEQYDLILVDVDRSGRESDPVAPSLCFDVSTVPNIVEGAKLFAEIEINSDAPALICFTSGSTGRPKAIVHSQLSLVTGLQNMILASALRAAVERSDGTPKLTEARPAGRPVVLLKAPMSYIAGFAQILLAYFTGAAIARPAPALSLSEAVKRYRPTSLLGASHSQLAALADNPEFGALAPDLQSIQAYGGEMPESLREALSAQLPNLRFGQDYGLSETLGPVALAFPSSPARQLLPTFEQAVRAEDGGILHQGEGELCLRGGSVMLGYQTSDGLVGTEDGWFSTGDQVMTSSSSSFVLHGRKSRARTIGSRTIAYSEIEAAAIEEAKAVEAAAFSRPGSDLVEVAIVSDCALELLDKVAGDLERRFDGLKFRVIARGSLPKLHGTKIDYPALIAGLA